MKDIADLLFPDVKLTPEDILARYPKRKLSAGQEVTRFAPSPTGYMHIGGFFQVLIDRTLAKNSGGVFYLRNEDTDSKREVEGALEIIFDVIDRFCQTPDEYQKEGEPSVGNYGPYTQSERVEIYKAFAKKLVAESKAFPCFCKRTEGKEEILEQRKTKFIENDKTEYDPCRDMSYEEVKKHLDNGEKFAIRLKTPNDGKGKVHFEDVVKGDVELPENAKDIILLKNDGIPPYAFAHAIDDTLMGTTIVVRGEEWFPSTPAHVDIFNALGFKAPRYYHTPNICKIDENGNKRKLSKRKDPESNMQFFIENGYLKEAVIEYLLNLISSGFESWRAKNPDASWSDFKFGIKDITAVGPIFDMVKLNDISKNIFARMSGEEVFEGWKTWAKEYDKDLATWLDGNRDYAVAFLNIDRCNARPRKDIVTYSMIKENFSYMFEKPEIVVDEEVKDKFNEFMECYCQKFVMPSSNEEWFNAVKEIAASLGYATDNKAYKQNPENFKGNVAKACEFVRIAVTGRKVSPTLFDIIKVLGEKETRERIKVKV